MIWTKWDFEKANYLFVDYCLGGCLQTFVAPDENTFKLTIFLSALCRVLFLNLQNYCWRLSSLKDHSHILPHCSRKFWMPISFKSSQFNEICGNETPLTLIRPEEKMSVAANNTSFCYRSRSFTRDYLSLSLFAIQLPVLYFNEQSFIRFHYSSNDAHCQDVRNENPNLFIDNFLVWAQRTSLGAGEAR